MIGSARSRFVFQDLMAREWFVAWFCSIQSAQSRSRGRVAVAALTEAGVNRLRVGKGAEYKKACELRAVGGHDLAFLSHGVGFACFRPLVQVKIAIDHGPNAKSPREAGFFCWLRGQDLNL
ncbi:MULTISPECIES: hypothetical protein [unclassified Mesorhizobium]|uniref:hypothetical protein n=1 Tax=unclassified Mesorhizobium TaxID=325217 RepID=UPI003335C224